MLGCGGTIASLNKKGADIYVLIITEGCSTQYKNDDTMIQRKRTEAENANKILGVKDLIFENLPDMKLDSLLHVNLNEIIENYIKKIKPDIVFTHFPDINNDHKLIYHSTMVALRPVPNISAKKIYLYPSISSTEWTPPLFNNSFMPNTFFCIEETLNIKLSAFKCYQSEIRKYPHPRSLEGIKIYAKQVGITVGLEAAEPFHLIRYIIKHD